MCCGYRGDVTLLQSFTISVSLPCESKLTYPECCFLTDAITKSYWRHSLRWLWVMRFVSRPVNLISSTSMLFFLCCKSNVLVRNCILCRIMIIGGHSVRPWLVVPAEASQAKKAKPCLECVHCSEDKSWPLNHRRDPMSSSVCHWMADWFSRWWFYIMDSILDFSVYRSTAEQSSHAKGKSMLSCTLTDFSLPSWKLFIGQLNKR